MSIIFNEKTMKDYYQKFDPIAFKYGRHYDAVPDRYNKVDLIRELAEHEQSKNFSDLTKKDFYSTLANLKMIYGNEEQAKFIVGIYQMIYAKVIGLYINIDGMERLFSERYVNYEWELHLGLDYKTHTMTYYRDHFIHQVKDAYMMDILLNECNCMEHVKDILKKKSNSKISNFVMKYINIQLEKSDLFADKLKDRDSRINYYLENIINMSSYMASLFHDIGYPIVSNMTSNYEIMEYIFESYNLNDAVVNFNKIRSVLGNSLLFRVEAHSRIKKRLEGNSEIEEKIDHGAVSAIIFLLHFYENGAIYRLEPYKVCAVELAGLAIFNHNNQYTYIKGKKEDYERNVFVLNPVSYLLRICDDLQEWGRIYFQWSQQSNLILCDSCKMPIVRDYDEKSFGVYRCRCNNKTIRFGTVFSKEGFPYRRVYKVITCKEVKIQKNTKSMHFEVKYDLNRLLHIAYLSPIYAKHRSGELMEIRKMLTKQEPLPAYVDTYMSANIIAIKAEIVGEFLGKKRIESEAAHLREYSVQEAASWDNLFKEVQGFLDKAAGYIVDRDSGDGDVKDHTYKLKKGLLDEIDKITSEESRDYLRYALNFYASLYVLAYTISLFQNKEMLKWNKDAESCFEEYIRKIKINYNISGDAKVLVDDYFRYAHNRILDVESYGYFPDKYLKEFDTNKSLYVHLDSFCDTSEYLSANTSDMRIDAYSDLYLFNLISKLNEVLEEEPMK